MDSVAVAKLRRNLDKESKLIGEARQKMLNFKEGDAMYGWWKQQVAKSTTRMGNIERELKALGWEPRT